MTTTIYETEVTAIGELVSAFREAGYLVFFGANAPEELHEFCILHEVISQQDQLRPGDIVFVDDTQMPVLAVGSVANENLMNLGHLNLKANGLTEPEMPGDVTTPVMELPVITVGTKIKIIRND
jgi:glucitol/sorbitol PTS system EIIA component